MSAATGLKARLRAHPMLADALLALLLYAGERALDVLGPHQLWPPSWPIALGWELLGMVPVVIRRSWPVLMVALMTAHTLTALLAPRTLPTEGAAIIVTTYTLAAYFPLRRAVLAFVVLWVPTLVMVATMLDPRVLAPVDVPIAYLVASDGMFALVCFFVGRTVHNRRAYVAALEGRTRAAEIERAASTVQAVAEERRRIARELHDMVAHHVSVMGVLAAGSRRTLYRDPAAADEALVTIEETGRTALREMRRLLDVLRTDTEPAGELSPQPGIAAVASLVEQVREAGLPVTLTVEGSANDLEPGMALTVYRIVQEALTNTIKHAGPAQAGVRLNLGGEYLVVEIRDDGRGPRPGRPVLGHGLLGMRERVSLYGGVLRAGARPGGGYQVYAKIPVEALDVRRGVGGRRGEG
jgi:signal transduction histidine kinase